MPYGKVKTQEVQRRVRDGLRLPCPEGVPKEFYDTAASCWKHDRHARPSFKVNRL